MLGSISNKSQDHGAEFWLTQHYITEYKCLPSPSMACEDTEMLALSDSHCWMKNWAWHFSSLISYWEIVTAALTVIAVLKRSYAPHALSETYLDITRFTKQTHSRRASDKTNPCKSDHTSFSHLAHRFINSLGLGRLDLRGWKGKENYLCPTTFFWTIINRPFLLENEDFPRTHILN